jgi:DNA-binding response OmpR family regulator
MLISRNKVFDKNKGKIYGSNEYLTKPFDFDDLVAKVSKYLPR